MTATRMRCALYLFDPKLGDPEEITRRVGIEPTATWRKGDRVGTTALVEETNGWELASPYVHCVDVAEVLNWVLSRLGPLADRVAMVRAELGLEAELSLIVCVEGDRPALHFDAKAVQLLASLGAEIDIDIVYWIGPDEPKE